MCMCVCVYSQLATTELMHMFFYPIHDSNHTFATEFNGSQYNVTQNKKYC